ncbi:hypothetical protein FA15DRAFT_673173 [Coprinopsis marcescibilis]|uniref:Tail specific protease domain-containing protein n=1 Tax=Coprinopsis marcescibilis TaxID=230819 RepID=A0A5C3KKS2_COPMA|nr:hypothetical protein FA15DRAFT_673173 [Coprinopsis marcescibilis]
MSSRWSSLLTTLLLSIPSISALVPAPDPCAAIAGQKWVLPSEARACIRSFPLDPLIKSNVIEVVNKTLAFHTSVNYQVQAPPPYDQDVHEDLHADLDRIASTPYESEFDFHLDIYLSFKRVNDGHCGVYSRCFDSLYISYLPLPLSLLTEADGSQNIYISPEAYILSSAEFADSLEFWQDALPGGLKLQSLSGAKVLEINGQDPWVSVNTNANVAGSYQAFGTRQNGFFSSYHRGAEGWEYLMGNFASHPHPLVDFVSLTILLPGQTENTTFTIPYRSRFGSASKDFTDGPSLRANNCLATKSTNGIDLYGSSPAQILEQLEEYEHQAGFYRQQPALSPADYFQRHPLNVILDAIPLGDIELPPILQPALPAYNESYSVAEFFMLKDNATGVLALGSFSAKNFTQFGQALLDGLGALKEAGAERLVVDVTNNGGGYICIAHWLHRLIIGAKSTTVPQAGLDTTTRAGPLAKLVTAKILAGGDPAGLLYYNPAQWNNATHQPFPADTNWLDPHNKVVVNGREDAFSQRLGQECQPFRWEAPAKGLFEPHNVVIVSNGRCASSCSLFSITMSKEEGVRTVVVGGKADVQQHYCGIVGGQSTDFSTIDTEIKSTKLKDHPLSPPDFVTNSIQGITWRLGYGINDPTEPEEWQDHSADISFPVTKDIVNQPLGIWEAVARVVFKEEEASPMFVAQGSFD